MMAQTIIQSHNYVPKQQGWRVDLLTGEAEFNSVTLTPKPVSEKEAI